MPTLSEAPSVLGVSTEPRLAALTPGFDKTTWQREYYRKRLTDPEYRALWNEYQRAYHKAKRASGDPEYKARRNASKQKYRSKLQELN